MSANIDDLTVDYTEDGVLVVKELDKEVLTKGAWSTILFRYQDWDRQKGEYGRYQKRGGEYMQKSKFNISSRDQARRIVETLQKWIDT
ncbi:MAG: hypothetical protein P8090_01020 [Gammaproteobacteria bacterium]